MQAVEAARLFKLWATSKGYIAKTKFAAEPDGEIEQTDFGFIEPASEAMLSILHRRGILLVGFNDQENKVIVYTDKKLTKQELKRLPEAIDTVGVTYKQGGIGTAGAAPGLPFADGPYTLHGQQYTCGSSINPATVIGAGTLGCLVRDADGTLYGLSANHVTGGCNFSQPGLPILAPGPGDVAAGHLDPFTIGHHSQCLPMTDGLPQIVDVSQNTDASLLTIVDADKVSSMQRDQHDTPQTVHALISGQEVTKVGRSSGLTNGVVESQVVGAEMVSYHVAPTNSTKIVFYDSLFIIRGKGRMFAEPGDSGALIVANVGGNQVAVGIVIAVNTAKEVTFALPLDRILQGFGVTLVSGHNV